MDPWDRFPGVKRKSAMSQGVPMEQRWERDAKHEDG